MSSKPDTITVVTKVKEEIDADAADVEVSVVGSSLFSGQEAFKKAQEVKTLTKQLIEAGISENRIKLRNVQVDSASFAILKSSSVRYTIKIASVALEDLPAVLGIIGSQKNCTVKWLEWIYNRQEDVRKQLRKQALEQAIEMVNRDAEILGVKILGVYKMVESSPNDSVNREFLSSDNLDVMRGKASQSIDLGFALGNATNVKVNLKVEFRVSEFL